MRLRLQDVAAAAGVSESTVSRVMNGKPGVSAATKANVVSVLARFGYEPESLRSVPRSGSIGLIVPELDNPVFPAFAQAIEAHSLASGYVSILGCAGRAGPTEEDYAATFVGQGVSGLIIVSGRHADIGGDHRVYDDLVERDVPVVLVNGCLEGTPVPSVSSDDRAAAVAAYAHLAALGHERIGFLTGPVCYVPVVRKLAGFRSAAVTAGVAPLEIERRIAESMFTVEGGAAGMRDLLNAGVTGVVAASDMMALGAIRVARELGLDVPRDVSIVGYDDTELMRFTDPPLTTIRQPVEQIADHAVSVLTAQITGQRFERRDYLVEGELIARASTALCRSAAATPRPARSAAG